MTDVSPTREPADDLDSLEYSQLHDRAFALAQHRRDIGFFIDLYQHTQAMNATADEGGSLGEFSGTILEAVAAAREAFGKHPASTTEPLFRARFIQYLREHAT